MKKSHLPEILACLVVLLGATYFMRAWKIKKDRAACIFNIRNAQQAARGYLGMNQGSRPTEAMWNAIYSGPNPMLRKPACPSGGTYIYHTSHDTNPPLGILFCTCSHAETLGHEPEDYSNW